MPSVSQLTRVIFYELAADQEKYADGPKYMYTIFRQRGRGRGGSAGAGLDFSCNNYKGFRPGLKFMGYHSVTTFYLAH